mgnify:CR=1 FL=1
MQEAGWEIATHGLKWIDYRDAPKERERADILEKMTPAERADVIVDFSAFAGQTLILYNDAPAAFPARVPSYDYYTGAPDQFPNAAPGILPGYGPNIRTMMQVVVRAAPVDPPCASHSTASAPNG